MKKVSIVIPVYNSSGTLVRCIDSVLQQEYENIELILVNDGSTDNSLELINSYESYGLVVFSQENKGACSARNTGIKNSSGYYVKFLDADDFLEHGSVSTQVKISEICGENIIPYGYSKVLQNQSRSLRKSVLSSDDQYVELINDNLTISLPLHRKSILDSVGLFDETLKFRQEWDLHLRLAGHGYKFNYHDDCIFTQCIHGSKGRISARKLDSHNEISNLNAIRAKFSVPVDSNAAVAWSSKYWTLGRQFIKQRRYDEAQLLFEIAKNISPKRYISGQPFLYRAVVLTLGVLVAERLISFYKCIK